MAIKPFLLLTIRPEEEAAAEEFVAIRNGLGVDEEALHRIRIDREWPDLDLADWSGIILGGGAYTMSDPEESKSAAQRTAEAWLMDLLDAIIARDFPFLGACYGIGTVGRHQGFTIDTEFGEPVGGTAIRLTEAGRRDPLFDSIPDGFIAYVGHKEAMNPTDLDWAEDAVLLASSAACPVQAFRVGRNVYATQFHPELDLPGILTRIDAYRHAGYFAPDEADEVKTRCARVAAVHPPTVLANFARRYATPAR